MFDVIRSTVGAFTCIRLGPWQALGETLLVGEGNFSFAKSLLLLPAARITHMTATSFEKENDFNEETASNVRDLKRLGTLVLHNVDATRLEKNLRPFRYDAIIFQFPNTGSREAKHGHNPNHILIRNFLRSAAGFLKPSGRVMISAVDTPHYQGAFQFEESAEFSGYEAPEIFPFDPGMFPGYSHTNTNNEKSAIEDHNDFATWVFEPKQ